MVSVTGKLGPVVGGATAKKLLEEFEALQEGDRAEVLAELLRRVAFAPHDPPDPDDLVSAADQIFLELDRRERSQ